MILHSFFYWGIGTIMLSSLLSLLLPRWQIRKVSLSFLLIGAALLCVFAIPIILSGIPESFSIFSIGATLKFDFIIDRLAAFFIFMLTTVSFAVGIYSFSYVEHYSSVPKKNLLVGLMSLFVLSMVLVVASKNMLSFFFFWEMMSITSFILVNFEYEKKATRKAGLYYLVMTQLSSMLLLAAFCIIYFATGSFDIQLSTFTSPVMLTAAFMCLFLAFAIKAGAIPFHKRLPYAHPAAPSNISALMSGLMIKVAIYGLIRFLLSVLAPKQLWWGILILTVGALSAILGVIYALKEHDIKRLLAYHSIENIGIILMGIGLFIIFTVAGLPAIAFLALGGALFHTLNHALFKSLLFLTAGSVVQATGTMNIEKMGGIIKRMPITATLFLIGAVAISALPPLNGFVSELMLFQAFFQTYLLVSPFMKIFLVVCASLFALTSALAAACFVKAFGIIFLGLPRSKEAEAAKEVPRAMLIGPAILAVLCIALGIFSYQLFEILGFAFFTPDLLLIGILLIITYVFVWILLRSNKSRVSDTWACGYPWTSAKTQYTASGFSEPIIRIFDNIYRPKQTVERKYLDNHNVIFSSGTVEIRLMKFFEEYLYLPIAALVDKTSRQIARLQDVDLDISLMYVFVAALAIIIIMRYVL